jgi:hypothetical protein
MKAPSIKYDFVLFFSSHVAKGEIGEVASELNQTDYKYSPPFLFQNFPTSPQSNQRQLSQLALLAVPQLQQFSET